MTKPTTPSRTALKTVVARVADLRQSEKNPRRISGARLDLLKRTLEGEREMLEARPLIALPDGTVIAGNQRLAAAVALGWETIPVVYADVDEATAAKWMLLDNRAFGEDDPELLASMLREMGAGGLDLEDAGYLADDVDAILRAAQPVSPRDPDEAPPVPEEPRSRLGEVYDLGPHRLMCGDSTVPSDVEKLIQGERVHLLLTDPPYCSGGFQESGRSQGSVGTDAAHKQIANDRLSTRGYIALLKAAFSAVPCEYAYVFTDWRMWVYLFDVVESSGYGVRSMVVWDKGSPGMGRGWRSQHELIMWGAKSTPPFDKHAPGAGNVIGAQRTGNELHTTQKPVDLLQRLLEVVPFVETAYDPFGGSGSTLIACEMLGRRCFAMELDPGYCDVIRQRYADYVGDPTLAP